MRSVMSIESADNVRTAFRSLGDLLAFRGAQLEIVVVGGAAMLLLGVSTRVTKDVDVVAVVVDDQMTVAQVVLATVRSAVEQVARDLGLPLDWINPGPDSLLEFGLPDGFLARTKIERYGSLIVHVADRVDLIALKLYAAVDQGPESKHFQDLLRLFQRLKSSVRALHGVGLMTRRSPSRLSSTLSCVT